MTVNNTTCCVLAASEDTRRTPIKVGLRFFHVIEEDHIFVCYPRHTNTYMHEDVEDDLVFAAIPNIRTYIYAYIHQAVEEDPVVAAIHANAVQWDPDTEYVYGFLQVSSCICYIHTEREALK